VRRLVVISIFTVFIGCGAISDYRPLAGNEFGYSERRLYENSYEVSFKGHKKTSRQEAIDFAVLRGLEIGATLDYNFMLITSTRDKTSSRSRTAGGGCYPDVYGRQVCSGVKTYRRTYPGMTIQVQFFDAKPDGRYLPESLFEVQSSYKTLRSKYRLDKTADGGQIFGSG